MYQIIIEKHLDEKTKEWFDNVEFTYDEKNTILTVDVIDDSHLHGILNTIKNLNLTLISVNPVSEKDKNKTSLGLSLLLFFMSFTLVFGQSFEGENQNDINRHSIGSSVFVSFNLLVEDPADFYMLNYNYKINKTNSLFVEAITWKYNDPMGTTEFIKEFYPGKIRSWGVGIGYQRFIWNNLFTTLQVTPMQKQYYDLNDKKIQKGFMLHLQAMIGYRIEFYENRWYLEPTYVLKFWPIDSNFPDDFAVIEKDTPNHVFEPSINFGFIF